jgi:ketosteroid isomerase-like protein
MTRSPKQVLKAHLDALQNGDVRALVADYADDAVIITAQGVMAGHNGIEAFFTGALQVLPEARFALRNVVHHEDVALLNWTAIWPAGRINDGVDTFVFRDGSIRAQTTKFTAEPV